MVKFYDVEQNTEEWLQLRVGKITASSLSKIMANYGERFGEPAKKYAMDIAFERVYGKYSESDTFSNYHTRRGHEQEPLARMEYESQYFAEIENGGFFDCGDFGCSPDGMIVGGGVIEIKSQIPSIHFQTVKSQSFPSAYKWQIAANCMYLKQPFIDCISYCADVTDDKRLYVRRFQSEELKDDYEKIQLRIDEFLKKLVNPFIKMIKQSNYSVGVN